MKFGLKPVNYNVTDLKRSLAFYEEALGLKEINRKECPDYTVVRLGSDGQLPSLLELTCRHGEPIPYPVEYAPYFEVEDHDAALAYHRAMGCVVEKLVRRETYAIADPDGKWIRIYPKFSVVRIDLRSFETEEDT
ncbi:MAG: VOC family protein [Selenomonadales bacterium]|nr:VOC family protein [Selenomonadales bacterium]